MKSRSVRTPPLFDLDLPILGTRTPDELGVPAIQLAGDVALAIERSDHIFRPRLI
jgi:hypothetical protein